jgi:transcriptional regulator with XRE-family HTH domain
MKFKDRERVQWQSQIHKHLKKILASGVSREDLAAELGVTKQAISSYMTKRTTPKPHILKRLLLKWPRKMEFRGSRFGSEAFGSPLADSGRKEPQQQTLFEMLRAVKKENMRVEVERDPEAETGLKLVIRISG